VADGRIGGSVPEIVAPRIPRSRQNRGRIELLILPLARAGRA